MKNLTKEERNFATKAFSFVINDLNAKIPENYIDLPKEDQWRTAETYYEIMTTLGLLCRKYPKIKDIFEEIV